MITLVSVDDCTPPLSERLRAAAALIAGAPLSFPISPVLSPNLVVGPPSWVLEQLGRSPDERLQMAQKLIAAELHSVTRRGAQRVA